MELISLKIARKMLRPGSIVTLMCWEKSGEIKRYDKVIVTSCRYRPDVLNVMIQQNQEVRQIRTKLIFMLNDFELCL